MVAKLIHKDGLHQLLKQKVLMRLKEELASCVWSSRKGLFMIGLFISVEKTCLKRISELRYWKLPKVSLIGYER